MFADINALSIIHFHDRKLAESDWPVAARIEFRSEMWNWIKENHRYNTLLWNEEDKARRTDVDATEIAASKRLIDRYNQHRNDAIEAIDETLLNALEKVTLSACARLHSETAGSMIDRMSILSLRIFHMREQTQRLDAGEEHVLRCETKLKKLQEQRSDLALCFNALLVGAENGSVYFKIYRQFKMYNDPTLNPYLYGRRDASVNQGAAS
jgi:hypothetical protein